MKLCSKTILGSVAAFALVSGLAAAPAPSTAKVLQAVERATPASVANVADVRMSETGKDALSSTIAGSEVTVPNRASSGIRLGSADASIKIELPFAGRADPAEILRKGIVSYDNNNGSSTVPVVEADGTVQINTVIHGPSAPTRYAYSIGDSATTSLEVAPDGSVVATDSAEGSLVSIAPPWAKDARGRPVATHYEVDKNVLTQVVDLNSPGIAYPVVADPTIRTYFGYYTVTLNRSESATAVGTVAGCAALFSKAPHPAMRALAVGCGTFAAYSAAQLAGGKCLMVHVAGAPPVLGAWGPTFPRC